MIQRLKPWQLLAWTSLRLTPPLLTTTTRLSMSTTSSTPGNGFGSIPISCPKKLPKDDLLRFPAFRVWFDTLQHSLSQQQQPSHEFHKDPYVLRGIEVQAVDFFGKGRIGFVKLKADVSNAGGERLPGSVFLRGGSVGMLVRVRDHFSSSIILQSSLLFH
jgi:hypothetical protein